MLYSRLTPASFKGCSMDWACPNATATIVSMRLWLAVRTGVTVVLKGHCTVVATREQYYVNQTGNAGMATAGTGDVLTGVIAALMGQGMSAMDAAILGVRAHGSGDAAAAHHGRISMTALDLLDALAEAFSDLEHEAHR
ncbi:MAG: NAD(P)H-hydrate dehydratase [Phycisphaerae bacterium]